MLDRLREQREVYAAEVERLRNVDLTEDKNARYELAKATIDAEVEKEHNDKIAAVELKVSHYDFVIAEEEKALEVQDEDTSIEN